jgi:hypothetical protein
MICPDHWRHLEYLSHSEECTGNKTVSPHSVLALTYMLPARVDRRPDILCCIGVLPFTCNYSNQCFFYTHSQNCEKRPLALSCLSLRLSVRVEQFRSHYADFQDILHVLIFFNLSSKFKFH